MFHSPRSSHFFLWMMLCASLAFRVQAGDSTDARADFLKLIERPRVALAAQVEKSAVTNGLLEAHFSFASEAQQRVPGLLVEPEKVSGPLPGVIVMHGTGGKKEDELSLLRRLARRGFVAVAIDGRYFGERAHRSSDYDDAIVRAFHGSGEHPFYYDTVWDILRLVDYLQTRPDVDGKRIGLSGISKGGTETYLAAAVDPRIAAAVPFIGVQDFHWALEHEQWQGRIGTIQPAFDAVAKESGATNVTSALVQKFYDRVVPGIYTEFDGPALLPLIAPRPLLMVNGDSDDRTPLAGVINCTNQAYAAYQTAGVAERFEAIIQKNTAHKVNRPSEDAMIDWFARWLAPK
jgi:dienelactone hydrolase